MRWHMSVTFYLDNEKRFTELTVNRLEPVRAHTFRLQTQRGTTEPAIAAAKYHHKSLLFMQYPDLCVL